MDNNINSNMINSATAAFRHDEEMKKIAMEITEEQQHKEKQFMNKLEKQIELLERSLEQSEENYKKLNALYELKNKELEDSQKELMASKKYNKKMMWIAIISAGLAVISIILTILFEII